MPPPYWYIYGLSGMVCFWELALRYTFQSDEVFFSMGDELELYQVLREAFLVVLALVLNFAS